VGDSPIRSVLRALDALDLDTAISLFAPDAKLMMVFGERVAGRDSVEREFRGFLGEIRAMHHKVTSEWNPEPGVWIAEIEATYELSDFSESGPIERAFIVRTGDDGIEDLRIYGAHEVPLSDGGRRYLNVRGAHGWLPTL
jgi:SnoaL-like domain